MNYNDKKEEIIEKHHELIALISKLENVDMGVAFDMLVSNVLHGQCYGFRVAKADCEELLKIAEGQVNAE